MELASGGAEKEAVHLPLTVEERSILERQHTEACAFYRQYSTLRWVTLGGFLTVMSVLTPAAFGFALRSEVFITIARVAGFAVVFVFLSFEWQYINYMDALQKRLLELEDSLGHNVWRAIPKTRYFRILRALPTRTVLLYGGVLLAWSLGTVMAILRLL